MKVFARLATAVGAAVGLSVVALPAIAGASAAPPPPFFETGGDHAVFVQTDNPGGNQVVAYHRNVNGTLVPAGTYATDGAGGELNGSVVDHLASQGSLTYDPQQALLYAVNAGSNSVSVFSVHGDQLDLRQVVSSGGTFPVSVAVHGTSVYVLNALSANVQGFVSFFGRLYPLPGSSRSLGFTVPTDKTQFVSTPGQVAFTPDGSQLIVTTKASGNDIDLFRVGPFGYLSASPVVNSEPNAVPFAVNFDAVGHLVVADAGTNALTTYVVVPNGTLIPISTVATGQSATCWVATAQGAFFASNAGSANVSSFAEHLNGQLALLGATGTDPGTVDAAPSAGGQFLYVQTGGTGTVDEFEVGPGGSLTGLGSVLVPGAVAGEGIVAF
ncbi:MAG TPA: beta-propeller fold lactonase family protein [Acidimicrobiales bacterium]|nr:beta-propeller fold lactonase family protein [Acidimicrobiales bacterium]